MVSVSMEGREPGKPLLFQVLLSQLRERELVVVLLQKEAALGSCPRAYTAGTELAPGMHKADVHKQGKPCKTQETQSGFCDCSSDCNHLCITAMKLPT